MLRSLVGSEMCIRDRFSTVRLEEFVPANHPLRPIRVWVNEALAAMDEKLSLIHI